MPAELLSVPGAAVGRCLVSLLSLVVAAGSVATHDRGPPGGIGDRSVSAWCGIVDLALVGHVYNSTTAATHRQCWLACQAQPRCSSVNYAYRNGQCDLNTATHNYTDDLSEGRGWMYTYSRMQVGL